MPPAPPYCSDFSLTTDEDGVPCVELKVPSTIKQNPGGLKRSRGAQLLDQHPNILIYGHPDPFLDGATILRDDAAYREAVERGKPKDKPMEHKIFPAAQAQEWPCRPQGVTCSNHSTLDVCPCRPGAVFCVVQLRAYTTAASDSCRQAHLLLVQHLTRIAAMVLSCRARRSRST